MVESPSAVNPGKKKTLKRRLESASPLLNKNANLSQAEGPACVDLPPQKILEGQIQETEKKRQKKDNEDKLEDKSSENIKSKYPVLKNEKLIKKFLAVTMTNNQKGRIRQTLKNNLIGTSNTILPDVINNRITSIIKGSPDLNDAALRKLRILYNMLKTAITTEKQDKEKKSTDKKAVEKKKKKKKKIAKENKEVTEVEKEKKQDEETEKKEETAQKVKGKKRYVVFVGSLPLNVNKEMIMQHFFDINEHIVSVRIPKQKEEEKGPIAYIELDNEPAFELALSKHHTMLGNKRIRVVYTTQKNSKISKSEAKSKSAKLIALQKSGKLIGSTPLNKKRSQRRLKAKKARAKEDQGRI